jgi:MFS family permease
MFTMASGRFTADWLVTRFGITKILRASGVIIATGLLTAVLFPYLPTATIGFLLVGAGTSSVVPLCYGMAGRSKTMHPGVAVATVSSIGFMGFLLGPPIIGFIAQASSLRWSFTLVALLGLTTTALASRIKPN